MGQPCVADSLHARLAGVVTVTVSLAPVFQNPRFRAFRASLFAALGLWGIAPALHGVLLHSGVTAVRRAFVHDLAMGSIYLVRCPHARSSTCCSLGVAQLTNCSTTHQVSLAESCEAAARTRHLGPGEVPFPRTGQALTVGRAISRMCSPGR